jgi:hypothetical protein
MKVSGTSALTADRATVWAALNDPAVLVATIPGCRRLETVGTDAYAMTVAAGVGSIRGVYDGEVRLTDQQEPGSFRMHAQGSGSAGTIGAEVAVTLADAPGGGTSLTYEADAVVGGMIGGVGQRMLTGVSKRMADEFFSNVDRVLAGAAAGPTGAAAPTVAGAGGRVSGGSPDGSGGAVVPGGPAAGQVFTAPEAPRGPATGSAEFAKGAVLGAAAALAGVMVGAWIAGRQRPRG